jgi:transcriptional regulator with XRE-family HTH domain
MPSAGQIRAARTLLAMSQADISARTGLSVPSIKRVESERMLTVSEKAIARVVAALEKAGVIFVDENGEGPGVRLRKGKKPSGSRAP